MLSATGHDSMAALIARTVPQAILSEGPMALPEAMSESAYLEHIDQLASKNTLFRNHIGMGYHPTEVPSVIRRNVMENPGWYTAYTPYQAEIAQGRLEALLNFQTMVCELTGMELANASLLDEATAAAEAMTMLFNARSRKAAKAGVNRFVVSDGVFPQTWAVLRSRAAHLGIDIEQRSDSDLGLDETTFGLFVQYPDDQGRVEPLADTIAKAWPQAADGSLPGKPYVVCTGGEPLLQLDTPLIDALHARGFEVAVETNGTQPAPPGLDWICVSPKADAPLVLTAGHELKLVYPQPLAQPERFAGLDFQHFFLQPMDSVLQREHTKAAVAYCMAHPQWRLSVQMHKVVGIA